jgi:hypothetical protein
LGPGFGIFHVASPVGGSGWAELEWARPNTSLQTGLVELKEDNEDEFAHTKIPMKYLRSLW